MQKLKVSKVSPKSLKAAQGAPWKANFCLPQPHTPSQAVPIVSPLPVFIAHLQNYYSFHVNRATLGVRTGKSFLCCFRLEALPCSSAARTVKGGCRERGAGSELWEEDECRLRNIDPTFSNAHSLWKSGVRYKITLAESTGFA